MCTNETLSSVVSVDDSILTLTRDGRRGREGERERGREGERERGREGERERGRGKKEGGRGSEREVRR